MNRSKNVNTITVPFFLIISCFVLVVTNSCRLISVPSALTTAARNWYSNIVHMIRVL